MVERDAPLSAAEARQMLLTGKGRPGMRVTGVLDFPAETGACLRTLPPDLQVDVLNIADQEIASLPEGLRAYEVVATNTPLRELPPDLNVEARLDLSGCAQLESLPAGLSVGSLILRGCSGLIALPERLDVWFLDLTGCWAFEQWPSDAKIHSGRLLLRGCAALRTLPAYLGRVSAVDVRDCPNLSTLPQGLKISGWLDIAHSGLTTQECLPPSLDGVQLRWTGVNIDRRIAFHPESITVGEVLSEKNAERRRVLLDRYGYGRFLHDAGAKVLDSDTDPGGKRRLLKISLEDDEDLVAMSCYCPSTGRQYVIRVPPTTPTCRHAAAWIAGFDDPDDYQPLMET